MVAIHVVSRGLAATLGPGRVSAFQYSGILTWTLPILLANSILVPLFPSISEKVVKKEMEGLKEMLRQGTETLVFCVTPVVISIIVLRVPIVRLLFERGEFTSEDTALTAYTLAFFAPLILTMVLSMLCMEAVVSLGLVNAAGKWTVLVVPVYFLLASTFMRFLDVGGIALAFSLGLFVQTGIGVWFIRRSIGAIGLGRLLGPSIKVFIGCAFCAVPTYCVSQFMEGAFDMSQPGFQFIGVGLGGVAFFLLYACFSLIFCRKELGSLLELTRKRAERKSGEMTIPVMGGG
jgi:putative peptidoglycan lipid II flippase